MNFQYNCPECKKELFLVKNKLHCDNCSSDYSQENNYMIFKNHNFSHISNSDESIKKLLEGVKNDGFETAVKNF